MRLIDHLRTDSVLTGLRLTRVDDVLQVLVDAACSTWSIPDPEHILSLVREREAKMTTGIGHFLAVPHAKCDQVAETRMACCTLPSGVDFRSPDKQPVRIAFLLLSPSASAGSHVRALATISRITPDLLERLVAAPNPVEFLALLEAAEANRT